ncbi:MAG: tetratricopeptide repeat protein [Nitrospinales bacterium]|nr:tetratricopeptide repeat protein [Nitrospinales bacterium]
MDRTSRNKLMRISICILLVIATFIAYMQVLKYGFITSFDDTEYLTSNWNIKAGLTKESIVWAFSTSYAANWHPLTWLSHMLDYELYGMEPFGHHLTSLIFHITNTLLLFGVLLKMTGALWRSGLVAVLFALHPLNVESVAWVSERKNVLSTFFLLLTLWAYVRYVDKKNAGNYLLVVLFLALGLMSKPMLVTLPFVLLLLDFWPLKRFSEVRPARLILEKVPLFILIIGSCVATFITQKSGGAIRSSEFSSLYFRVANALVSYFEYLRNMLWPSGLSVFYPHPGNALPIWKPLACTILLVVVTIWVVKGIRRAPYLAVGWFWYLGTLVPVIGIVQVGEQAMADRYTYVPLIGIFIAIAWSLPEQIKTGKEKLLPILSGIVISLLIALTWIQVSHWKNSITLFKHAINVTDTKYLGVATIHAFLGDAYHREGELGIAISEFKKSLDLDPINLYSLNNLAATLAEQGNLKEGLSYAQKLSRLQPDYTPGLITMGNILEETGKLDQAQIYYEQVLERDSDSFDNYLNLANILYRKGNLEGAIPHYKKVITLNPNLLEAHYNLGNIFGQLGQPIDAKKEFEQAIRCDEKQPLPHYGLGLIELQAGNYLKAIEAFEQALSLNPKLEQARHFLAQANEKMRQK